MLALVVGCIVLPWLLGCDVPPEVGASGLVEGRADSSEDSNVDVLRVVVGRVVGVVIRVEVSGMDVGEEVAMVANVGVVVPQFQLSQATI